MSPSLTSRASAHLLPVPAQAPCILRAPLCALLSSAGLKPSCGSLCRRRCSNTTPAGASSHRRARTNRTRMPWVTPVLVAVQGAVRDDTAYARGALRTARCARELQRRASSRRAEMPHASGHWRQRSRGKPPRATFADAPAHARHVGLRCRRPTRTPSRGASAAPSCTWSRARDTSGEQLCALRGHLQFCTRRS